MNGAERVRLIGWWVVLAPVVGGAGVGLCAIAYAFTTDPGDLLAARSIFLVLLVVALCGGIVWVFGKLLFRETRDVLRSARERKCKGRCPACGYMLRGNTSGICPECGRHVKRDWKALEQRPKISG